MQTSVGEGVDKFRHQLMKRKEEFENGRTLLMAHNLLSRVSGSLYQFNSNPCKVVRLR